MADFDLNTIGGRRPGEPDGRALMRKLESTHVCLDPSVLYGHYLDQAVWSILDTGRRAKAVWGPKVH